MIFKGNFLYTPALGELTVREGEYLVVEGEKCAGFYRALPQEYAGQSVTDFGRALVLPAFCDLHLHAPQMVNRGVGYDQELLPWLETYTFPVEARYGDADFAEAAWKRFLNRMWANGTLRFSAFATIHKEAVWRLMELTERAGLSALIGKVNMDRNAPDSLREDTDASLADTEELICRSRAELKHVGYILTPRFVPSTTARLMNGLGRLGERYGLPVQSHLSENRSEIAWVAQLHPECASYTEVYRDYGLLRRGRTIMAHAVHLRSSTDMELIMEQFPIVIQSLNVGFLQTLKLFFVTLLGALPLGLIIAFGSMSHFRPLKYITNIIVWVVRGTPLMIQMLIIYYFPGLVLNNVVWGGGESGRFVAASVAFIFNYACYFSVIYRGGIQSVPQGQTEAGLVLGMTKSQIFFKITLMQMIKRIVPPMSNEIITLVKDTSLARIIALQEIIWAGQSFLKGSQGISGAIWPMFFAAVYYLVFNGILTVLLGRLEKKLDYFR